MAPDADAGKSAKRADPFAPLTSEQIVVGDGHDIYVESVGRAGGIPAVYLHGGPGSGCQPDHRRLFDPERFHAVLFDQRGAGRSRPKGSREANTLQHLIADMEAIREKFAFERWMVVGGSWGATLALAYAQTHPERVSELILRGIYTLTKAETDWYYQFGVSEMFPDKWERFLAPIPEGERGNMMAAYHKRLTGDDPVVQVAAAKAWSWPSWNAGCLTVPSWNRC